MPRIWKLLPLKLPLLKDTFGTLNCRSAKASICRASRALASKAETEMGTSWTDSDRFCAVTTTSSIRLAP